jgi:hypothetical protein
VSSKIPEVKAKLIDFLKESSEVADVEVYYGLAAAPETEFIAITGAPDIDWTTAGMGPQAPTDETFSLTLYVSGSMPGNSQQEATERCFEIFNGVCNAISDSTALAAAVPDVQWIHIRPRRFDEVQLVDDRGTTAVPNPN